MSLGFPYQHRSKEPYPPSSPATGTNSKTSRPCSPFCLPHLELAPSTQMLRSTIWESFWSCFFFFFCVLYILSIDKSHWVFHESTSGVRVIQSRGVGVQNVGIKTGSRMCCTTQRIQPIFCNYCKWKVTFKSRINIKIKKKKVHLESDDCHPSSLLSPRPNHKPSSVGCTCSHLPILPTITVHP